MKKTEGQPPPAVSATSGTMPDDARRLLTRMLIASIDARESEAARIARALHDDVGQVLSAVGLQLDVLKFDFKDSAPDIGVRAEEIQKLLDTAVQRVRALSYDLNPAIVERAGLQFALDRLIGRFRDHFAGTIRFQFDPACRLPLQVASVWYKLAERALDNAVRHCAGTKIDVQVRQGPKDTFLEVRDNGVGFSILETKLHTAGLGLLMMEHYAAQANVDLSIQSTPGKGTVVRSTCSSAKAPGARKAEVRSIRSIRGIADGDD